MHTCETCSYSYTQILKSHGHAWEEIENVETATQRQDVLSTMRINLTDDCVESYSSKPETRLPIKVGDKYTDAIYMIAEHAVSKSQKNEI